LRGHVDGLRSGNAWEVLRLRRLAEATPIPALLSELDEAEQEIAAAQSHLEGVERRLAIAMMGWRRGNPGCNRMDGHCPNAHPSIDQPVHVGHRRPGRGARLQSLSLMGSETIAVFFDTPT
jgi:hypothetical protein